MNLEEWSMSKKIVLFLVLAFSLTLLLAGCGDSKKDAAAQLTVGKEYTVKISSFAAKDEAGAKRMVELIRSENDSVLGKLTMDKVLEGLDDGTKVTVVSQQGNIVKVKIKGIELYVFADHLKP